MTCNLRLAPDQKKHFSEMGLWLYKKNTVLYILFLILMMGSANNLCAQRASATAHVSAEIVFPLVVSEKKQMSFGRFSALLGGGSVIINPNGVRSAVGQIQLFDESGNAGTFIVSGIRGAIVSVLLPDDCSLIDTNGYKMLLTNFNTNLAEGGLSINPNTGVLEVRLGAELKVGEIELNPIGMYYGSFDVVFMYN